MRPETTPPPGLEEGARLRIDPERYAAANGADWRLMGHDGLWEVAGLKTERRQEDAAPRLYVKLKSIRRAGGLAYITLPFDAGAMEIQPAEADMEPLFPAPGSRLVIREGSAEKPSARDGLWEVQRSSVEVAEGGQERLKLGLKSLGHKHQSYLNIAFNAATMKPVMPVEYGDGKRPSVEMQRRVNVFRPITLKK